MDDTEYGDAKLLWKMFYAGECFRHVRESADYLITHKIGLNSHIHYPLVTAIHVIYGRPFTHGNKVGRLDESIPHEHLGLHRALIEMRHKLYANLDGDAFNTSEMGPLNQVRAVKDSNSIELIATEVFAKSLDMAMVIDLCMKLESKTDYYVEKFLKEYRTSVPDEIGEYLLNVTDPRAAMWAKREPIHVRQTA